MRGPGDERAGAARRIDQTGLGQGEIALFTVIREQPYWAISSCS
jgi:hypothetical protein